MGTYGTTARLDGRAALLPARIVRDLPKGVLDLPVQNSVGDFGFGFRDPHQQFSMPNFRTRASDLTRDTAHRTQHNQSAATRAMSAGRGD